MITIAAIVSMMGLAMAACPNSCSGHGRCNPYDQCECFESAGTPWGQRFEWTGPDCSMRTCPLGIAFGDISSYSTAIDGNFVEFVVQKNFDGTNRASSDASAMSLDFDINDYALSTTKRFEVRILTNDETGTNAGTQIQWKLDKHSAFSAAREIQVGTENAIVLGSQGESLEWVPDAGVESTETGIRVSIKPTVTTSSNKYVEIQPNNLYRFVVPGRDGRPYKTGDANTAHQQVECSGRGSCDRGTGRCQCFGGYGGEACQRNECPNQCSQHGICQTLTRFVDDGGVTAVKYPAAGQDGSAYDGEKMMTCLCDAGYRGPDCSQIECPSYPDPLGGAGGDGLDSNDRLAEVRDCSGRGMCDYASGTCSCFSGYFGEACEQQTTLV